ncbi:hypothetical protein [Streptomyces sp. KL116D]|uniref:hypothetical protein n=1 Tax=Streptomyces sp. KL116D TaxID=3045152 RepID=UPI0035563969
MNLYKSSGFLAAMEQEVAESTKTSHRHRRQGPESPGRGGAQLDGSTTRETLTTYLKEITPITVIRLLMDTLRKEDNVVDVDLTTGRLTPPGASRTCSPEDAEDAEEGQAGAGSPVPPVQGDHRVRLESRAASPPPRRPTTTSSCTPRTAAGTPAPRSRVTCFKEGIAEELKNEDYYTGEFRARCLGKVRAWNPAAGGAHAGRGGHIPLRRAARLTR